MCLVHSCLEFLCAIPRFRQVIVEWKPQDLECKDLGWSIALKLCSTHDWLGHLISLSFHLLIKNLNYSDNTKFTVFYGTKLADKHTNVVILNKN